MDMMTNGFVEGSERVKKGLHSMPKGGVIIDVMNLEQAKIAEAAGACAVRIPADIPTQKGVARMPNPKMIKEIINAVSIPVMAKCRIGHFVEAQILQELGIDYIDESEDLTVADHHNHVNKSKFRVPFVCGCSNLGEALRRIAEGARIIRTKDDAGTGDVSNAVLQIRTLHKEIRAVRMLDDDEIFTHAKEIGAPVELLKQVKEDGKLPVVNFAAGGVATPADAALCMQLGMQGVFVSSDIFKSTGPDRHAAARAIVQATTHFNDPQMLAEISESIGDATAGINCVDLAARWADCEDGHVEPAAKKAAGCPSAGAGIRSGAATAQAPWGAVTAAAGAAGGDADPPAEQPPLPDGPPPPRSKPAPPQPPPQPTGGAAAHRSEAAFGASQA